MEAKQIEPKPEAKLELEVVKSPKSLVTKLAEVMGEVERIGKRGHNDFHNYDYATEADIAAAVRKGMAERHLMLVPSVLETLWGKVQTKSGEDSLCTLKVQFTVMDGDSDQTLVFTVLGQGTDRSDKATYKAMTGAMKYALLKLFLIPTGDDPEKNSTSDETKPPAPLGTESVKAAAKANVDPRPSPPKDTASQMQQAGRPSAVTFRFGGSKGKSSHDVNDKDLEWYVARAKEAVADATKAQYLKANTVELASLQAELRWRMRG